MANRNQRWSLILDKKLWEKRDSTVEYLADYFGRTKGSIMRRLEALRDPHHSAHQMLSQYYGKSIGIRKLKCNETHIQYTAYHRELLEAGHDLSSLHPLNKGKTWTKKDDVCLWNHRDCPVAKLAEHHGRTEYGIRKRVELLVDPESTPRRRLFGSDTESVRAFKQSNSSRSKKRNRGFEDLVSQRASKRMKQDISKTPDEYMDPLTAEVMNDPVMVTRSGHTYERASITKWIRESGKDPYTRIAISERDLVPNRALKAAIDQWRRKNGK